MKRTILAAGFALAMVLPHISGTTHAIASATTGTSHITVPLTGVYSGCTEAIYASGSLDIYNSWKWDNTGAYHFTLMFAPHGGLTATGLTTGASYQMVGQTRYSGNNAGGAPSTSSFVNNFRIIGPGPDSNLQVHENIQVTFNANGTLTAYVDNSSATCR